MPFNYDKHLENRQARIDRDDAKAYVRWEKQEKAAQEFIGELCREGNTVYYINKRRKNGTLTGKTVEFGSQYFDAVNYLVRNNYI